MTTMATEAEEILNLEKEGSMEDNRALEEDHMVGEVSRMETDLHLDRETIMEVLLVTIIQERTAMPLTTMMI